MSRGAIEKGRRYSLLRQIESRTAPTLGLSDSDREASVGRTDRGKRRCRSAKPRSLYSAGEERNMTPEMAFECVLVPHDPAVFGAMDRIVRDLSIHTNV